MATKIRKRTNEKKVIRAKRKRRIRGNIEGRGDQPRLSVFRSNKHLYVQLIDDTKGRTLVCASTQDDDFKDRDTDTLESAKQLGTLVAKRALSKNIARVVFDRSGYLFHGRIKALADAVREGGLKV